MAKAKRPEPLLPTPESEYNKNEHMKIASDYVRDDLHTKLRDLEEQGIDGEAEQLAKSHGIYLEYNRAKTGRKKDWMYMVRISVPAGGSFDAGRWKMLDDVATKFCVNPEGNPSLRLTTRQNVQFHWIKKADLVPLVREVAKTGYYGLNGCGDNTRNVMGCPLSKFSDLFNCYAVAQKYGEYFELPNDPHIEVFEVDTSYDRFAVELEKMQSDPVASHSCGGSVRASSQFKYQPNLLNRKFKIGFSAVHRDPDTGEIIYDNCAEIRTQDLGIAPIVEGSKGSEKLTAFQVYIGGGQGEKNGKPTFATLGRPLGICSPEDLLKTLDAVVQTHSTWGDRKNRNWARLKYVVHEKGASWFLEQVRALGANVEDPNPEFDPGPRMLHHGWHKLPEGGPGAGKLAYGAFIENGRVIDRDPDNQDKHGSGSTPGNGEKLRSMINSTLEKFSGVELMITANQDALFTGIDPDAKEDFEGHLQSFGHGKRKGKAYSTLRVLSGACVGLHTCRLSYTESEQFEPELIDTLEEMGYGDIAESIGITGCERQCFRPATKTLGFVGQGPDMYALKLGGTEDGRHQGTWLVHEDKWYLRQVPRAKVPHVVACLIDDWKTNTAGMNDSTPGLGEYLRSQGVVKVIETLKAHPELTELFEKALPTPFVPEPGLV